MNGIKRVRPSAGALRVFGRSRALMFAALTLLSCIVLLASYASASDTREPSATQAMSAALEADWNRNCGPICVTLAARLCRKDVSLEQAVRAIPRKSLGTSRSDLKQYLDAAGLYTAGVKLSDEDIGRFRTPLICYQHMSESNPYPHFLVVLPLSTHTVQVIDYPNAPFLTGVDRLKLMGDSWQGDVLIVSPEPIVLSRRLSYLFFSKIVLAVLGLIWAVYVVRLAPSASSLKRMAGVTAITLAASAPLVVSVYDPGLFQKQTSGLDRPPAGSIRLSESKVDFGRVRSPAVLHRTLTLTNNSPVIVDLSRIVVSCSCLKLDVSQKMLDPGRSAVVKAELRSESIGSFKQGALFFINSRTEPSAVLSVIGTTYTDEEMRKD